MEAAPGSVHPHEAASRPASMGCVGWAVPSVTTCAEPSASPGTIKTIAGHAGRSARSTGGGQCAVRAVACANVPAASTRARSAPVGRASATTMARIAGAAGSNARIPRTASEDGVKIARCAAADRAAAFAPAKRAVGSAVEGKLRTSDNSAGMISRVPNARSALPAEEWLMRGPVLRRWPA